MSSALSVIELLRKSQCRWESIIDDTSLFRKFYLESIFSQYEQFAQEYGNNCFSRSNSYGHFTGSALLVTSDFQNVLLTLHRKLDRWLQLGGHADDDVDLKRVAERETCEESGLQNVQSVSWGRDLSGIDVPFDFDCHVIPAFGQEPRHFHFDVRFIFATSEPHKAVKGDESKDISWFSWEVAKEICRDESTLRQIDKFQYLKNKGYLHLVANSASYL